MKRKCGVLLPISSLPSRYGIGCFSREAYAFVDFLADCGQSFWQILPMGQTGYGDSPYQSFSTFAGNPYFIDLQELVDAGYLTQEQVDAADFGQEASRVCYERIYEQRYPLLRQAYHNSPLARDVHAPWDELQYAPLRETFENFIMANASWLEDYALYSAIKESQGGKACIEWPDELRLRDPAALARCRTELSDEIRFWEMLQFLFARQWEKLKKYANRHGIRIIGDIPIYVAFDSADTWSHPELFEFDEKGYPTVVAGVPPDAFSDDGQLWGNPIYRWDYHKKTGYAWWLQRLSQAFRLYDVVRIDHFRGFDEYWAVPYSAKSAKTGEWRPGPGMDLFDAVREELGKKSIIAEDLGILTDSVVEMVKKSGFPGMKVLQFAFDPSGESEYLPHRYPKNCVVYTGTHDNQTTRGWYDALDPGTRRFARAYAGIHSARTAVADLIRIAFMSQADTVIIPMQDYLNLGDEARINTPSTLGGNWEWRLVPGALTADLASSMRDTARMYDRSSGRAVEKKEDVYL